MRVVILASGSRGNATIFESSTPLGASTRILVDAGLSLRGLKKRLASLNEPQRLDAVVVTHAHRDHVGHCRRIAAAYGVPLLMSESTARTTGYDEAQIFSPREPFAIGALTITPTPLPHDAAQVALAFCDGVSQAALCTDLGEVPARLAEALSHCDLLLLEANHDLQMLRDGPYPYSVKRRIASAGGHLSNAQSAELLRTLAPALERVVLMHLSEANNRPALALQMAEEALRGHQVAVQVAAQDHPLVLEPRPRPTAVAVSARATTARRRAAFVNPAQLAFAF